MEKNSKNSIHNGLYIDELAFAPNNGRFSILTDTGFSDFIGVTKKECNKDMIEVICNTTSCKVTHDHKIFYNDNKSKHASDFIIDDDILTTNGIDKVVNIKRSCHNGPVYDVLNVFNNHRFYSATTSIIPKCMVLKENCLYIDELGFLPAAEEFYESVYPTISSSDTSKVIITSTPKGLNFFYKMWVEAERCESDYIAYDVKWYEHPDRDQKWYDTQCANLNAKSVDQEINCVAADTLINIAGEGDVTIESIYNKYAKFHTTKAGVIYISDISIGAK